MQNVFKFAKTNQLAEELDRSQCFFVDLPLTETRSDGEEFALGHFQYIHELLSVTYIYVYHIYVYRSRIYIRFSSWAFTKRTYTLCLEQVLGKNVFKRDLMLGKTFYSPNLTNLFYFSAPNIKISDQKYAKMNIFRAVLQN